MKLTILDIEHIYRRMLAEPNPAVQEQIFHDELAAPYEGLARVFGSDVKSSAAQWGMYTPDALNNGKPATLVDMLDKLAAVDAWSEAAKTLDDARAAFAPHLSKIPLEQVTFGLLPIQSWMGAGDDDHAYAGFGGVPGWIMVTVNTLSGAASLPRLKGASAHELLHNLHFSVYPFRPMQTSVGGYIIAEGLAESFAAALYGESATGPWVRISAENLETGKRLIGSALDVTGFNQIRRYIFGDKIVPDADATAESVPEYAGYAIGYRVVQAYLQRTGKTVPETIFVPADEIIAESGYFA